MPELPEVETVRRGLEPLLCGRTIAAVACSGKRLRIPWPEDLHRRLTGRRFTAIQRRAKYLLLDFDEGRMLCHLGMSGCLRLLRANDPLPAHQHLLLTLDDGNRLSYADPRRFGMIDLTDRPWEEHCLLRHIGPEPLEASFHDGHLHEAVRHRNSPIKTLLLDSSVVAGIGNIYANEALFTASIAPTRRGSDLTREACRRLVDAIRSVLTRAIAAGGSTIRDFTGSDGRPGYFAHQFLCYEKEGAPCPRCGGTITRIKQQGRASFFCPDCQEA